jgi:dienelactone hydrolase
MVCLDLGLGLGHSTPAHAEQQAVPPAETVQIPVGHLPFDMRGFLRRPKGRARVPAVVLLPGCSRSAGDADADWGARIASWGYATLTLDTFEPRGIRECGYPPPTMDYSDLAFDAYRGLDFLIARGIADSRRAVVVGFARGALQTLMATERGAVEQASRHKFRAAAAFYPTCGGFKGVMTVPTLILIGDRDEGIDACKKMAAGEDDAGISRKKGEGAAIRLIAFPDAYRGFDVPALATPQEHLGHRLEFNQAAADQAREALRAFLAAAIGDRQP